ncbi:cinnamycin family lantibiotic [Spirillospora sp. NPDC049652]
MRTPDAQESMLRHAAADAEVRDRLLERPADFGVLDVAVVPGSVEQPDTEALAYWTTGLAAIDVYACWTTCSEGLYTMVCDGMTK